MKISIKIEKQDLGFSPKQIKSLLSKLDLIKKAVAGDNVDVNLDFEVKNANELSVAIIWRYLHEYKKLPCEKKITYRGVTQKYFDERHFFDGLTGKKTSIFSSSVPINYDTFSPVRPTHDDTQNEEINRIFKDSTKGVLDISREFESEVRTHMTECVQNAFDHSESEHIKPAGVICSLSDTNMLDFCVIDMGQGIRKSFLSNPALKPVYLDLNDIDLIIKATQKNISCNPASNPNPAYTYGNGGIGLYYLKEFVSMHPGSSMVIISGNGYYHTQYKKIEKTAHIKTLWPGTIVYFRIKLGQQKNEQYKALSAAFVEEFDSR